MAVHVNIEILVKEIYVLTLPLYGIVCSCAKKKNRLVCLLEIILAVIFFFAPFAHDFCCATKSSENRIRNETKIAEERKRQQNYIYSIRLIFRNSSLFMPNKYMDSKVLLYNLFGRDDEHRARL